MRVSSSNTSAQSDALTRAGLASIVRRMKIGNVAILSASLGISSLLGCFYPRTDFVRVEPVKYVPPPSEPIPNSQFGWVKVGQDEAERYLVTVGDLTYQRIIEPNKRSGEIAFESAVDAFATFAEKKVEEMHYCKHSHVPEDARELIGGNTPPEMRIYVECVEEPSD